MNKVYLLLGSNLGDRINSLEKAKQNLEKYGNILTISSIYETKAWGKENQPNFLNQIILLDTQLSAEHLLKIILENEILLGRVRDQKWSERTIDIDILYYNRDIIVTPTLKVPHPELHNRNFTLIPLNEISPDFIHPVFNLTNKQMLERSKDKLEVVKFNVEC